MGGAGGLVYGLLGVACGWLVDGLRVGKRVGGWLRGSVGAFAEGASQRACAGTAAAASATTEAAAEATAEVAAAAAAAAAAARYSKCKHTHAWNTKKQPRIANFCRDAKT